MTSNAERPSRAPTATDRSFFGHPRGLATLFFTEMWERFSYYGMRAILILFMTTPIVAGGLGFGADKAGPIYAMYTCLVYLASVPGGWLADNFLGQRRSVLYGGVVIMIGHILLAMHGLAFFYSGLVCVVFGTGMLKPNISVIVGQLYSSEDARRDAGFSIFYMGINLGALTAPLVCGFLAQSDKFKTMLDGWGLDPKTSWHWGFGAAAVGMFFGLIQYVLTSRHLGEAGARPTPPENELVAARNKRTLFLGIGITLAVVVAMVLFDRTATRYESLHWQASAGGYQLTAVQDGGATHDLGNGEVVTEEALESAARSTANAEAITAAVAEGQTSGTISEAEIKIGGLTQDNIKNSFSIILLVVVIGFFLRLFTAGEWTPSERARLVTIFVLFCGASIFWGIFEQAGSTLTLFAEDRTNNSLFGWQFPSSWWQSVNPITIVLLAPLFAWLWTRLGKRNPSYPFKFAIGLLFAGLGFAILVPAAAMGGKASPLWLLSVYVIHTIGELCLSPVGLSSMTRLAPAKVVSLMMGVWFLAAAVGNFIGGSVAGFYESFELPSLFGIVALSGGVMAFLMFLLVLPMRRMMQRSGGAADSGT